MKNPTLVLKTSKFDILKVVCYVVLYKLQQKPLTLAIGIDHFLDTRTVKIQARNYIVVTSCNCKISIHSLHVVICCFLLISICLFMRTRWFLVCTCTMRHVGFMTLLFDVEGTSKEDQK